MPMKPNQRTNAGPIKKHHTDHHAFTIANTTFAAHNNIFQPVTTEQLYELYQQFPSVQTDTRKLKKGDMFLCTFRA